MFVIGPLLDSRSLCGAKCRFDRGLVILVSGWRGRNVLSCMFYL